MRFRSVRVGVKATRIGRHRPRVSPTGIFDLSHQIAREGYTVQHIQFVKYIAERDIDLLLLEELHVSPVFQTWFVAQMVGEDVRCKRFLGARHSVSHLNLGESDLIVLFEDDQGRTVALLIENKIDAPAQPTQGARYHLRGNAGIECGDWAAFRTCMTAPDTYLQAGTDTAEYDVYLSYESIRDWFQQFESTDKRSEYKARVIQEAIEQNRKDYVRVPNPDVTRFYKEYWDLASKEFPNLQTTPPRPRPARSDWVGFCKFKLRAGLKIRHKMEEGFVDLEIWSAGARVEEIETLNRDKLTGGLVVVRTGKSASIRHFVPEVDRFGDFSSQKEKVRAGLLAASRLLDLSTQINLGKGDSYADGGLADRLIPS